MPVLFHPAEQVGDEILQARVNERLDVPAYIKAVAVVFKIAGPFIKIDIADNLHLSSPFRVPLWEVERKGGPGLAPVADLKMEI